MTIILRLILFIGALATSGYVLFKIRRSKVQIEDSIFWLMFSFMILVLSIFPDIAIVASEVLGIMSPVNFIFLVVLFVLIVHQFSLTIRLSQTNNRLKELVQKKAIDDYVDVSPTENKEDKE